MRDILTIIASIVILILAVAVAAPPFITWEAHRDTIDQPDRARIRHRGQDRGLYRHPPAARARITLGRLRLGGKTPDSPVLDADYVRAEVALMPLLQGEVRFTETRVGRADIRIPVAR